ncbi:MAG: sodium/solute symporter [Bryobacteraceae bacterium]|jgi:SSS family solute:Na+ symporter
MGFSLTAVDWVVCLLVIAGSIWLGLYLAVRGRVSESSANFFLAGRKLTWPIVGASLFASNIGAEHLVGLSGDAYRYGLCAGSVELTTFICLGFAASFLFPYYIQNKVFTIPEFLEMRYSRAARTLFSGLMLVICIMTKMAFHLYAGGLVLHGLLGWNVMTGVALAGILVAIITVLGGFTAVAYTDSLQSAIMIGGCGLMLFIGLAHAGGWHALAAAAPAAMSIGKPYDDPNYPFWGIICGSLYGGIFYWGMDQVNVQRVLGARDLRQARWGSMFTVLLKLTPVFIFALPGVIACVLFPGREAKTIFVTLLNELLPNGVRGIVLAALMASLISSNLSVMNSVSTLAVRDFVLRWRPGTGEKAQVLLGRCAIVAAAGLGIVAAYLVSATPDGLYKYLQTISLYLVMPIAPTVAFGILSRRVTAKGALVSVLFGSALATLFVADQLMGPAAGAALFPWLHFKLTLNYTFRGFWAAILTSIVLFLVSAFTEKAPIERLEKLTIDWRKPIERFTGVTDWRLQLALLTAATIGVYAWLW